MGIKITHGRLRPKPDATFGKKKPFKSKGRNRKGSKIESSGAKYVRLRDKPNQKNKKTITLLEKEYLDWFNLQQIPCFACGCRWRADDWLEGHHIKEFSTDGKNHKTLLPLCAKECHKTGTTLSAHGTPKKFREAFLIEIQLEAAKVLWDRFIEERCYTEEDIARLDVLKFEE